MSGITDSFRVFAEETNVLQTDKANALTLMRSMTRVFKRIKEDELFESVREALIEDMKMRWDQNFCGEHMCLTLALCPTLDWSLLPANLRDLLTNLIVNRISQMMKIDKEFRNSQTDIQILRQIVRCELGRFISRDGIVFHKDFRNFWITNAALLPCLSFAALRSYDVPISESAVERAFAELSKILREDRHALSDERIAQLLFFYCKPAVEPVSFEDAECPPGTDVAELLGFFWVGYQNKVVNNAQKFARGDRVGVVFRDKTTGVPFVSVAEIFGRSKKCPESCWEVTWVTTDKVEDWDPRVDFQYFLMDDTVGKPKKRTRTEQKK